MKRLSKILGAVLILLVFSTIIMAQSQKGLDNRTTKIEFTWNGYWQPLICNGSDVGFLAGPVETRWIVIQKDGIPVKIHAIISGKVEATWGEVFKIHEKDVAVPDFDGTVYFHFNLKGNQGSHYVGRMIWDPGTSSLIVEKAICPGNK